MYSLVVSRYKEPIEWLNGVDPRWEIKLYNKGDSISRSCTEIPNMGRESETYLRHIIENYDDLPEYICFIQANPFDHSPDIIKELLEFTSCEGFTMFKKNGHSTCNDGPTTVCNSAGAPHHTTINILDLCREFELELPNKDQIEFSPGAQFFIDAKTIKKRNKEFYEKLILKVNHNVCPTEAYILERVWRYIFV
jgi:hypothetical protein